MYDVVVKKFAFAIFSPDEFLFESGNVAHKHTNKKHTDRQVKYTIRTIKDAITITIVNIYFYKSLLMKTQCRKILVIIIHVPVRMLLSLWHIHCDSSYSSFHECELSAG